MPGGLAVAVVSDGDVGGVLAAFRAAEEPADGRESDHVGIVAWPGLPEVRNRAVGPLAAAVGARLLGASEAASRAGEVVPLEGRRLLDCASLAASAGCGRLVWPVHPIGGEPEAEGVTRAARAIDVATLVGRLVTVELGREFVVETPLVDLVDEQVAELAGDLGVDVGLAWWSQTLGGAEGGTGPQEAAEARTAASRWRRAFEAAGLGDLMPEPRVGTGEL